MWHGQEKAPGSTPIVAQQVDHIPAPSSRPRLSPRETKLYRNQEIQDLAQHFSEWTDDEAPVNIQVYRDAARAWIERFD